MCLDHRLAQCSGVKRLRDARAGEAGRGEKAVQVMLHAGHGGKAGHEGDNVIGQAPGQLRMSGGDEAVDGVLGGGDEDAGGLPRLRVIAAGTLDGEAASGGGIGLCGVAGVAAGSLLQHGGEGFGHRAPGTQDLLQGNALVGGVAAEGAGVEARLAADGRFPG